MNTDNSPATRYKLSFTVGGLFLLAAPAAAQLYLDSRDWRIVRAQIDGQNLLQARTVASAQRRGRELYQRLSELTDDELDLLVDASLDERAHLMWVATCRPYELIGEFAEEVLRERFLLLATDIQYEHFDSFLRGKTLWHPELAELKESTLKELRKTLFRMMREAGLITKENTIVPAVLSQRLIDLLNQRDRSDLRFFPTREGA